MFNLFKKEAILNKEAILEDIPKNVSKVIYPKEVLEIHHEFEVASDKLVEECKNTLVEAEKKDVVKVERLEKLGFKQAAQVIETRPLLQKAIISKEQIALVQYYKENYPLNKFITEEQVEIICKKYNLICGEVNRFKGFVPEKNLKEIERFTLKNDDGKEEVWSYGSHSYTKEDWRRKISREFFESNILQHGKIHLRNPLPLQICAPVKDMDMSGMTIENGYKMKDVVKHIPDPVVLQPVKGGYLILTAWGDEASDPLVVNEINN